MKTYLCITKNKCIIIVEVAVYLYCSPVRLHVSDFLLSVTPHSFFYFFIIVLTSRKLKSLQNKFSVQLIEYVVKLD